MQRDGNMGTTRDKASNLIKIYWRKLKRILGDRKLEKLEKWYETEYNKKENTIQNQTSEPTRSIYRRNKKNISKTHTIQYAEHHEGQRYGVFENGNEHNPESIFN